MICSRIASFDNDNDDDDDDDDDCRPVGSIF